eukprot:SAG11_NODE_8938_length_961_cov_0.964037_1_plen_53_part_00
MSTGEGAALARTASRAALGGEELEMGRAVRASVGAAMFAPRPSAEHVAIAQT